MTAHHFEGSKVVGGHRPPLQWWANHASRAFAIVSAGAMLVLGAALLPAQQQPRAVIDPVRIMEARYEVARLWWDPARGNPLAPAKDFDDSSGQLRLLNKSG